MLRAVMTIAAVLLPALAQAHTGEPVNGWTSGFHHPLEGWDHLLVMIAVGLWAAQHHGRARWAIPVTFLSAMAMGGFAGAFGLAVPFVEAAILVSVVVLSALVVLRLRFNTLVSLAVVALFAVFHGLAHGAELPDPTSLRTFGMGFLVATALLHLCGYAIARVAMASSALVAPGLAFAQQQADAGVPPHIPEIVVTGRQDSLLGLAKSATEGTVGIEELSARPIMRTGELLETVPGVIITQHAGGGKANQYFLRGFNLDHGTDFQTTLDGMPINMRTHAHGQGYSDLNPIIPELIERVNYQKGVYDAQNGDFSSAGAAHMQSVRRLSGPMATLEGGMYGYRRAMAANSFDVGGGSLLSGADVTHHDGPWVKPDDFLKTIGVVSYDKGTPTDGFTVTARAYHGRWNSTDQVATSAVTSGLIPLFGTLNPTDGGDSQRYSLQAEWRRSGATSATHLDAYGLYYDLNLFSDFTYFLLDPVRGDQFEQRDKRLTSGLNASHTLFQQWGDRAVEFIGGFQFRNDTIRAGLFQTENRLRTIKVTDDGTVLPAVTRQDRIAENSFGFYLENKIQWSEHLRSVLGVREDIFTFDVRAGAPENTGRRTAAITSPKAGLIFGPWDKTELYLQAGLGFHSNDARGVLTHVDPDGNAVTPATPLVRTVGAEVGVRTLAVSGLQSTLSLWWLNVNSELVFVGDGGTTEAGRPSRRYGIEFANYYTPVSWLTLDADFALSRGRFRDANPVGNLIPESIESVISAGVTVRDLDGAFGSLRLRYFGGRPLIEDNSFRSSPTVLLNAQIGYRLNDHWSIAADVFNLLDRRDHDIDYAYESRVRPADAAETQVHFHPVEPRQVRVSLSAKF